MKRFDYSSPQLFKNLDRFARDQRTSDEVERSVSVILADVARRGDGAVTAAVRKFDHAVLKPQQFRVPAESLEDAARSIAPAKRKAIRESIAAALDFGRNGMPRDWKGRNRHGAIMGERFYPLRRVGIYVPGGRVPLVSTVVMTAAPARLAGVPEIAAFTPSDKDGKVAPEILAALHLAGVDEVYRIGGVQAIGAMAFGTKTIPAVDKIAGPGNAFVVEAKRQLFGRVGIDLLPGPSEVMVIADNNARPEFVAADLLAQAEHGAGGRIYLVAFSDDAAAAVQAELTRQAAELSHAAILEKTLQTGCAVVRVKSLEEAIEVANFVAPEHLEIHLPPAEAKKCLAKITTAGCILLGEFTPAVLGDFVAGPNHVLPTGRSGRFSSGLRVTDFMRKSSFIEYSLASLKKAAPAVEAFSRMEELDAHGRSARIRLDCRCSEQRK